MMKNKELFLDIFVPKPKKGKENIKKKEEKMSEPRGGGEKKGERSTSKDKVVHENAKSEPQQKKEEPTTEGKNEGKENDNKTVAEEKKEMSGTEEIVILSDSEEEKDAGSSSSSSEIMDEGEPRVRVRVPSSAGSSPPQSPPKENEYEVEYIADYDGQRYEVKWVGYETSDNTWEPYANLIDCEEKLTDFFLKRKREAIEASKTVNGEERPKKRKKLCMPPDPRPMNVIVNEFLQENPVSNAEIENMYVEVKLGRKTAWDESTLRESLGEVVQSSKKMKDIREQILMVEGSQRAETLRLDLMRWGKMLTDISQGRPVITLENNVDLAGPPADLNYINDYVPPPDVEMSDDPPIWCECEDDCSRSVSKNKKKCCPYQNAEFTSAYYQNKRVKVPRGTPIYECNKKCRCSADCGNRVVGDGVTALEDKHFSIFRTENGRGWGVKTLKKIAKGTFVCLYVGEIITTAEADRRGKIYDQAGCTYLFDLDFNETDEVECPYVVDAKIFGNISHFFNHSCDPNLVIYGVWVDCLDINFPKLALFASRDIKMGEELTFDYKSGGENKQSSQKSENSKSVFKGQKCLCGSNNCRGNLF